MLNLAVPLLNLITVIMEFASSFISFIIGYYALKAYRATSARGLFLLYWGFIILGVGTFLRVFTATYINVMIGHQARAQLVSLINLVALIYSITQLVAYSLFVATYVFQSRLTGEKAAVTGTVVAAAAAAVFPIYRLFFIPWLELVAVTMLAFVVVSTFMNWHLRKSSESALVLLGFGLILLSHVFFLFLPLEELLLFVGEVTQLAGFLCLSVMLAKVSRTHE
jgi:hypothetical protein